MSIDKAKSVLGYAPQFTSEDAVREAVQWMVANDELLGEARQRGA